MGLSLLTATPQDNMSWVAQNNLTGSNYSPITNQGRTTKQVAYTSTIANAAAGGANELVSYLVSVTASGNTTVNLQAVTDILNTANVNLARVKGYSIWLLSTTDDATYGTNCSSIRWGGGTTPVQFNLTTTDAANTGNTAAMTIFKGGIVQYFDQTAGGFTTSNTARNLFFLNNDATNAAKIELTLIAADS